MLAALTKDDLNFPRRILRISQSRRIQPVTKAEAPYLGLKKTWSFYCGALCQSYLNSAELGFLVYKVGCEELLYLILVAIGKMRLKCYWKMHDAVIDTSLNIVCK